MEYDGRMVRTFVLGMLFLTATTLGPGCGGRPSFLWSSPSVPDATGTVEWVVPERWAGIEPLAFERLAEELRTAAPVRLSPDDRGALAAALARQDASSVRAAVLLARSGDPAVPELLLLRL